MAHCAAAVIKKKLQSGAPAFHRHFNSTLQFWVFRGASDDASLWQPSADWRLQFTVCRLQVAIHNSRGARRFLFAKYDQKDPFRNWSNFDRRCCSGSAWKWPENRIGRIGLDRFWFGVSLFAVFCLVECLERISPFVYWFFGLVRFDSHIK